MERYTDAVVGEFKKFYADGAVREFKGNTFLCHIPNGSPFFRFAAWAQAEMALASCFYKYAFLPPESFHMTVYEGVCDQVRRPDNWVKTLPLDTPLHEATSYFFSKIPQLQKPRGFLMKVKEAVVTSGMQFILEPANSSTCDDLEKFRAVTAEVTGMVNHNAEGYRFHCSLAYLLQELSPQEAEEASAVLHKINTRLGAPFDQIFLGPVEFCYFSDMFRFSPLSVLK